MIRSMIVILSALLSFRTAMKYTKCSKFKQCFLILEALESSSFRHGQLPVALFPFTFVCHFGRIFIELRDWSVSQSERRVCCHGCIQRISSRVARITATCSSQQICCACTFVYRTSLLCVCVDGLRVAGVYRSLTVRGRIFNTKRFTSCFYLT